MGGWGWGIGGGVEEGGNPGLDQASSSTPVSDGHSPLTSPLELTLP